MNTIEDVYAKCIVDPATRCWIWRGAGAKDHKVRIYTVDHATATKRTMSGPTAIWNIAHGEAPPAGSEPYRWCGSCMCVNWAHIRLGSNHAAVMKSIKASGRWKGTHLEQRRASARKGHISQGIRITPEHVVKEILASKGTNVAVGARFGVHHSVVSRIRLNQTHRNVQRP